MILRTVISVKQLQQRICAENWPELQRYGGAPEDLESLVIPTGFPTANQIPQNDADVQGNLLCEYEQKFADHPGQEKLTKLCSNAAFLKNIEKGQFFITFDDDTLDKLMGSCREDTLLRSDESSQVNGWIRGNTKTSPVLEVKDCYHQGRCGVETKIEPIS